jgi:uncharacterized repeat protein (TIGR03803 family)
VQDTNGNLYGTTAAGGANNDGTIFSLDVGLGPFLRLISTSGKAGSKVGILGQGFAASSVVRFNGVNAQVIKREGTTFLLAVVPDGASDGPVTVTTSSTTLTAPQTFIVHDSWSSGTPPAQPRLRRRLGSHWD